MTELNNIVTSLDDEPEYRDDTVEAEQETEQELSDISPDSEPETETNAEEAKKPNKLQERLDKLTADRYAEKQRADELERKLKELESKQAVALPDDLTPPEMPEDTWDAEAMREYGKQQAEYYRKLAQHEARQALNSTKAEQQNAVRQQQHAEIVRGYASNAVKAGIDIGQLEQAGASLANAGLSPDLQILLLEDAAGPQMTMHLAKNPDLAFELIGMSPTKAAIKLATEVKAASLITKPKVSKAPDPLPEGKPASMREKDDFERQFPSAKFI